MRAVVMAVLAAVILAGCGGSDDSSGVQPLDQASSSATPSSGAAQNVTRPKDERSEAGAIAFSEFAVRTIVATTGGADVEKFLALSTDSCAGCIVLVKQFGQGSEEIQKLDSPPKITDARVVKREGKDHVVQQTVAMSAGQRIKTSDKSVESEFGPMTYQFVLRLTWGDDDRWVVSDYAVEKES